MIDKNLASDAISAVMTSGDFAEVFVEDTWSWNMEMTGGSVDKASSGRIAGIGIRGFSGTRGIYAYTNDFSRQAVIATAMRVAAVLDGDGGESIRPVNVLLLPGEQSYDELLRTMGRGLVINSLSGLLACIQAVGSDIE